MNNSAVLLKNIGLSDKEAIIYLVSLKLGSNPASIIAKYAEINRCTTYSILDSLIKKGLVADFEKEKIKYFTSLPPQQLINYVDEKRRDLAYFKNEIISHLPQFEVLDQKEKIIPSILSYSGKSGLAQIYNAVVQETPLLVWGIPAKEKHEFFSRFAPQYLRNHKSLRVIKYSKNKIIKYEIKSSADLYKLNLVQPVEFITRKKIILASASDSYGVEITNPDIVKYFKNKFNLSWKNKKASSINA